MLSFFRNKKIPALVSISLIFSFIAAGCQRTASTAVEWGRQPLNESISNTDSQQLLLNLVRMRYLERPFFLQVATVSTSLESKIGGKGSAQWNNPAFTSGQSMNTQVWGLGVEASYTEKPTITYTPLQGNDFVKHMMTPVSAHTIVLLYYSGWSIDRIFRVLLQSINGIPNAPTASGPTPYDVPQYKEFKEICSLLRVLQKKRQLRLGIARANASQSTPGGSASLIYLHVSPKAIKTPEAKRLYELLQLSENKHAFQLVNAPDKGGVGIIGIVPRSMIAMLFFASQSVDVPQKDIDNGIVITTKNDNGTEFNWQNVLEGLIDIHVSSLPPSNAFHAIYYRGKWFYIADDDQESKKTFALLEQISSLQSGNVESQVPLLTIPVAR